MIIDIHTHLAYSPIYPARFLSNMFTGLAESERIKLNKILPVFLRDKEGKSFLQQMDATNIDKAVLLIIDGGIAFGDAPVSIEEIYIHHYNVLKKQPDRYIVFAGIDPRRGTKGYNLFKKGIEEYNFRGLKLYPPMGFRMDHEELFPYYEYCEKNRLPVLLHTGPSQDGLFNEFAEPMYIAPIAKKYKHINFILAHAGFNLKDNLLELIQNTDNVYVDVAGFQTKYSIANEKTANDLAILFCDEKLNKKVLFGTDWPLFNLMHPVSREVELIKAISNFSNECLPGATDHILGKNAVKIFQ